MGDEDSRSLSRRDAEGRSDVQTNDISIAPSEIVPANSEPFSTGLPLTHTERHPSWIQYWASVTPLIVGALGPTLTLLAISGCADKWRVRVFPAGLDVPVRDPRWVIGLTATAILIGFIANIFLLLRMIGRGNPKYMQDLSILLWTLECISRYFPD